MKICSRCHIDKSVSAFNRRSEIKNGYKSECKECEKLSYVKRRAHILEQKALYYKKNRTKLRTQHAENYNKKRDYYRGKMNEYRLPRRKKLAEMTKAWRAAHPEYRKENADKLKEAARKWQRSHRWVTNANCAEHRAQKVKAMPKWANKFFIQEIYDLAQRRSAVTGFAWHVDHIVPLRSPLVCGFHVEYNLQVVPASYNSSKRNSHWPDMP